MEIVLEKGKKATAMFKGFRVSSDQPAAQGGEGSAPSPFDFFLASIALCSAGFAQAFFEKHGLPMDGVRMSMEPTVNEKRVLERVVFKVHVPSSSFPAGREVELEQTIKRCYVSQNIKGAHLVEIIKDTNL